MVIHETGGGKQRRYFTDLFVMKGEDIKNCMIHPGKLTDFFSVNFPTIPILIKGRLLNNSHT